jgi:hypothetical protein
MTTPRKSLCLAMAFGLLATAGNAQLMSSTTTADQPLGRTTSAPPPQALVTEVITFEGLPAGTVVNQVFSRLGSGPILVLGSNAAMAGNRAVIFDSANPTGQDDDLGTPNEDFGGPGIGPAGASDGPFPNDKALHEVLIISENILDGNGDGLVDDPDDATLPNSTLVFDFSALDTVTIRGMTILDVESYRPQATVAFFAPGGGSLGTRLLPVVGDNGLAHADLGAVTRVRYMVVTLNGSGAIDDIIFELEDVGSIGDFVWCDEDDDGIQDPGEPGIAGVDVHLSCAGPDDTIGTADDVTATTTTNGSGLYLFQGVPPGKCRVMVDTSTAPADKFVGQCPIRVDVDLKPGQAFLDADYCFITIIGEGAGCTPGYWKQGQHFDSWPGQHDPDDLFDLVFDDAFPGKSLLDVLSTGGGGLKALGRHTVAALLNSATNMSYPLSTNDVITLFNAAFASGAYQAAKDLFEGFNEQGCPLN